MKTKLLKGMLVATVMAILAVPSMAAEPVVTNAKPIVVQPVTGIKQSAMAGIRHKCPEHVSFILDVTQVPGWNKVKYNTGAKVDKAQITYQSLYGKDALQCMMGGLPVAELQVEKGSCVVDAGAFSFSCKPSPVK